MAVNINVSKNTTNAILWTTFSITLCIAFLWAIVWGVSSLYDHRNSSRYTLMTFTLNEGRLSEEIVINKYSNLTHGVCKELEGLHTSSANGVRTRSLCIREDDYDSDLEIRIIQNVLGSPE